MSKNKDWAKKIVEFNIGLFLSLFLFLLTAIGIISHFGLGKNVIFDNTKDSNMYQYILEEIESDTYTLIIPTGLQEDCLSGVVKYDDVFRDVNAIITNTMSSKTTEVDTVDMLERFDNNIRLRVREDGIEITVEVEITIQETKDTLDSVYRSKVVFPYISLIASVRNQIHKYSRVMLLVLLAMCALGFTGLWCCHRRTGRILRRYASSMIGCGLMCIALPAYGLIRKTYLGLQLYPKYFYDFAISFIERVLLVFVYFGCIWILAAVIMVVVRALTKNLKRGVRNEE